MSRMTRLSLMAALVVAVLFISFGVEAQTCPEPPLGVYRHVKSESGKLNLVVLYNPDRTFEINGTNPESRWYIDGYGGFHRTGNWGVAPDCRFWFQQNPTDRGTDAKLHWKPPGHFIGKDRAVTQISEAR